MAAASAAVSAPAPTSSISRAAPLSVARGKQPAVPPPISIDQAVEDLIATLPRELEPEEIPGAMREARQLFEGTPTPEPRTDLIRAPAPFPLDTDFFSSDSEWERGAATPHPSLITRLLEEASATAPAATPSPSLSPAGSATPAPGVALFEQAKAAARTLGFVPQRARAASGKFVAAKAKSSKGKRKRSDLDVNDTDSSVEILPSDTAESSTRPAKRARSGKLQIADTITTLTNHVVAEDAKYDEHAELAFKRQEQLIRTTITPLADIGARMLAAIERMADK
jgi:hypothetical protein